MHTLVIGLEALALQQRVQAPVAETAALTRQLDQATLQCVVRGARHVTQHRARKADQGAGAAFRQLCFRPHGSDRIAARLRA